MKAENILFFLQNLLFIIRNKVIAINHECPPGTFINIESDECQPCHGGRYGLYGSTCIYGPCIGDLNGNCTGPCDEGYYCNPGSSSPTQNSCDDESYYCPQGSSKPIQVERGYYSIPIFDESDIFHRKYGQNHTLSLKTNQTICEPGYWCSGGMRRPCSDGGYFGLTPGLYTERCTAPCPKGFYCTPTSPSPIQCPAGSYGDAIGQTSHQCSGLCSPGHYCPPGSKSPTEKKCPPSIAGEEEGLKDERCSLNCDVTGENCIITVCEEGFYCPENSTSRFQNECGNSNVFCPKGSSEPTKVTPGYYTTGYVSISGSYQSDGDKSKRSSETQCEEGTYCDINGIRHPCPAGTFGNETGLTTALCSGKCSPGYFCPPESKSIFEKTCQSAKYFCPEGSAFPIKISRGYFSTGGLTSDTHTQQKICPKGSFCIDGIKHLCAAGTYGSEEGLYSEQCSGLAKPGYYTPEGSTSPFQIPCPGGTYGIEGMKDDKCMGKAAEGFYTPPASTSATQFKCGDDLLFCPEGSSTPIQVSEGYYSVGSTNAATRSSQIACDTRNQRSPIGPPQYYRDDARNQTFNLWCPSPTNYIGKEINVPYHIDVTDKYRYNYRFE